MTRMHNRPHPGEVLQEYLGNITVTEAALKLGVNRVTLSRVVADMSGISAEMAFRLGDALGNSPALWAGMQMQFDLYQASKLKRPRIERFANGLFEPIWNRDFLANVFAPNSIAASPTGIKITDAELLRDPPCKVFDGSDRARPDMLGASRIKRLDYPMIPASNPGNDRAINPQNIRGAQVLMGCETLEPSLSFFIQRLGFRIDAIFPADDPSTAMISGYGLQLRLVRGAKGGASLIYLLCDDPAATGAGVSTLTAPNGVTVKLVAADPPMHTPATQQALVVTRAADADQWVVGRAGLRYRDLIPERHGGGFIASHIRVLEGGLVPDYVHFHKIRFQAIFCRKGWVRVVYEDQGEPFEMHAGDCVLQPPMIRHRVLASSAGAEVVEIGAPAEHITMADHTLELPNPRLNRERDFSGQRFVRHIAAQATWAPWRISGFEVSDTRIALATNGLAGIRVVRLSGAAERLRQSHATEFCFYFVLSGSVTVQCAAAAYPLAVDDSITIPGGLPYAFADASADMSLLEVTLPAAFETTTHT